jgi:hypothetical protein
MQEAAEGSAVRLAAHRAVTVIDELRHAVQFETDFAAQA